MTRADTNPLDRTDRMLHVGVICGRRMLTSAQRTSLGRQLQLIAEKHHGYVLVLHHGCGHDADEVAHRAARTLGNWRIHGHPACEPAGELLLREGAIRGLSWIYESKPPRLRDAEIVDASEILIAIRDDGSQAEVDVAVKRAQAANRDVVFLARTASTQKTPTQKRGPTPKSTSVPVKGRTPEWAAHQAREDTVAGRPCKRYKHFLTRYGLSDSTASGKMWTAYHLNRTMPAGADKTESKPKPVRNTVKRYDLVPPVRGNLSPRNAALLMKLNQQNTLGEMWR